MTIPLLLSLVIGAVALAPKELQFNRLVQLEGETRRFDLSGIVQVDDQVYVIADKEWDGFLYEIQLDQTTFQIVDQIKLNLTETPGFELDLEGVTYCSGTFYLINEKGNQLIAVDHAGNGQIIDLDYGAISEDPATWPKNAGYEGIAINCDKQVIYLAKERDPCFVLAVDARTSRVISKYVPPSDNEDVADLAYKDDFLYILERGSFRISKMDLTSMEVVDYVTYGQTANSPSGKIFEPAEYPMAEALMLTETEIWIGLDNNHVGVSAYAEHNYGIRGTNPVILIFDRPKDF